MGTCRGHATVWYASTSVCHRCSASYDGKRWWRDDYELLHTASLRRGSRRGPQIRFQMFDQRRGLSWVVRCSTPSAGISKAARRCSLGHHSTAVQLTMAESTVEIRGFDSLTTVSVKAILRQQPRAVTLPAR